MVDRSGNDLSTDNHPASCRKARMTPEEPGLCADTDRPGLSDNVHKQPHHKCKVVPWLSDNLNVSSIMSHAFVAMGTLHSRDPIPAGLWRHIASDTRRSRIFR
jgi:hypothetical protein